MPAELMKGQKWTERKHKMTYPAWVEIKVDEIRCRVVVLDLGTEHTRVQYLSYAEKPLNNLSMYDEDWIALAQDTGWTEFDTGLEVNGNFNDSYRWVRSKDIPVDLIGSVRHFILFDLPQSTKPFDGRMTERHTAAVLAAARDFEVYQPAGSWAHEEASVEQMFTVARERGFEGLMVKSLDHLYERGKRTNGWLKVKPSDDADGTITALHEAVSEDGTPLGRTGSITIAVEDGSTATPHGIAHELGREMHEHPERFIGQWAEFAFMERDRQGGYRHPVFRRVREAKA